MTEDMSIHAATSKNMPCPEVDVSEPTASERIHTRKGENNGFPRRMSVLAMKLHAGSRWII